MPLLFFVAIAGSFVISLVGCGLAVRLAPHFRSGERKDGIFRADQSLSQSDSSQVTGKGRRVSSAELPLVGSRGIIPAMLLAGAATGWLMGFDDAQWRLMLVLGGGLVGFWLVGFFDDWRKVAAGNGLREMTKFVGVALVSLAVAIGFWLYLGNSHQPYAPYTDIPGIGPLLRHVPIAWLIIFLFINLIVTSATSLAVDFSDGLDGLAGGLTFPAALALAVINLTENVPNNAPLTVAALALAGATMGFLPWNWPSSWKGRHSAAPRRARMIMGDSGSLAIGGMLAIISLADRQELTLIFIGCVFVLEGLSAVIQSRLLVRFYRRFLFVERFKQSNVRFPHTEFPLPFLATPMHHHFDLLGWDRKRLVYSAWTIAALFGLLGIVAGIAPFTWERYFARLAVVVVAIALWQSGHNTRGYFVGTFTGDQGRQQLSLCYGYPYRLFKRPLYAMVDRVSVDAAVVASPAEQNTLWVRTNVFDARATLGYFCYLAGNYALAREQWERIPHMNLAVRPQIQSLLHEARRRLAEPQAATEEESAGTLETAMGAEPSPAESAALATHTVIAGGQVTGPLGEATPPVVGLPTQPRIPDMTPSASGLGER